MRDSDTKMLLKMFKEIKAELLELRERLDNNPKLKREEKFLTKKQAEKYLQVSERQLTYMLMDNKIPCAIKLGGRWRFPLSQLEMFASQTYRG